VEGVARVRVAPAAGEVADGAALDVRADGADAVADVADVADVVVARLDPGAALPSTLPLVAAEQPEIVTSPSDSRATAALSESRPTTHLRVCRRDPTLRSLPVWVGLPGRVGQRGAKGSKRTFPALPPVPTRPSESALSSEPWPRCRSRHKQESTAAGGGLAEI
jgi:hypothetical protein